MGPLPNPRVEQYRARAITARAKAEVATDAAARKALLNDVELWERMAQYEELTNRQS